MAKEMTQIACRKL